MTLELFKKHDSVKAFYSNYYPLIIVDEFQDTNCIAWNLIERIINDDTKLLFLGDPLQKIYGFIGALPSLMNDATEEYSMKKVALSKNYRFRDNLQMLLLDANIRLNAQLGFDLQIAIMQMFRHIGDSHRKMNPNKSHKKWRIFCVINPVQKLHFYYEEEMTVY